ncbi:endonuclease/exonuclease/phosphatase family protein [Fibrobacter sp.]|uniref:endonuclease/exonuclease/phosphatase family protein n=1 Tax=Fibrobacter sp. TaxID=35828 RepID=UPI0038905D3A
MPDILEKKYNILFWNCQGKDNENDDFECFISNIVTEKEVHILILCECKANPYDFVNNINNLILDKKRKLNFIESNLGKGKSRISIFSTLDATFFSSIRSEQRFIILNFHSEFNIVCLHLKSQAYTSETTKLEDDRIIINDITKNSDKPLLFVGDFNVPPYSTSLLSSNHFNTIRLGEDPKTIPRKNINKNHIRINPCWALLGEAKEAPPGTLLYNGNDYDNLGWHLLDQVIFDYELKNIFFRNSLEIIAGTKRTSLIKKGKIDEKYSDHLPLFFSIKGDTYAG